VLFPSADAKPLEDVPDPNRNRRSNVLDFNTAARAVVPASKADTDRRVEALRAELQRRAHDVVRDLFPAAKYEGGKARIGDANGEPGGSMVVEVSGPKAGVWFDHDAGAVDRSGDLIHLWCKSQGLDGNGPGFMKAVADLEQHLGLSTAPALAGPVYRVAQERAARPKPVANAVEIGRHAYVYTTADSQKILAQVIRIDLSDGDKTYRQRNAAGEWKSPEVRPLYALPGLVLASSVVLVEGEKCADTLNAQGIIATSLMGGSATILDKSDLEPLRGKQVILWPDNDDAGRAFMRLLGGRLRAMGCDVRSVEVPAGRPPKWDAADAAPGEAAGLVSAAKVNPEPLVPGSLALVPAAGPHTMAFLSVRQLLDAKPPRWLVKGVLPEASLSCIIGPPGGFKSFVAIGLALALTHGRDWYGHKVNGGPVLYVAGEGQVGVAQRVRGWLQTREGDLETPFITVPQGVAMPTDQLDEMIAGVLSMPVRPVLIILDTLARCFGIGDENSSTDMGQFIAACDKLRRETESCVLIVHHTGKDVARGARGSSALTGAVDCLMAVKRDGKSMYAKVICQKQKDAAEFGDVALMGTEVTLEGIEDEDGAPLTTLVLVPNVGLIADAPAGERQTRGPTLNQQKVFDALTCANAEGHLGLGWARLIGITQMNPGTLSGVLKRMEEKGLIHAHQEGERQAWRCA